MNDYLGNLVTRTLGQMNAVEPRLASRFEQVESPSLLQGNAAPFLPRLYGFDDSPDADPLEVEVESQTENPIRQPVARTSIARQNIARPEPTDEIESRGDALPNSNQRLFQTTPTSTEASIKAAPVHHVIESPRIPALNEPVTASQSASRQTSSQSDRAADVEKLFAEIEALQYQSLAASDTRRTASSRPVDEQEQQRRSWKPMNGELLPGVLIAEPRPPVDWRPAVAALAPMLPPIPAIERQPVVKVTIGRVEVRAVVNESAKPAVAVTEKAPHIQALPLNEYLRRRINGEL